MDSAVKFNRWRVAIHEAGHVVVAHLAFESTNPSAKIWADCGLAFGLGDPRPDFGSRHEELKIVLRRGVVALAGQVAEGLFARKIPDDLPPVAPNVPSAPASDAPPAERAEFDNLFKIPTDDETLWGCCDFLARWSARDQSPNIHFFRMHKLTFRLLWKHAAEIQTIARELFVRGTISYAGISGKD